MRYILHLMIWAMMLALPRVSSAQNLLGTLAKGEYVLKKIEQSGCTFQVLRQVLRDSHIDPAKVRRLPVGTKVFYTGVCKKQPVAIATKPAEVVVKVDSTAIRQLTAENAKLKDSLRTLQQARKISIPAQSSNNMLWLGGVVGFMLILSVGGLFFLSQMVVWKRVLQVKDANGMKHEFRLSGASRFSRDGEVFPQFQCPHCKQEGIFVSDARDHLDRCSSWAAARAR